MKQDPKMPRVGLVWQSYTWFRILMKVSYKKDINSPNKLWLDDKEFFGY